MNASAPIGIFDSGIGGLTVASAIHRLLPRERLVYFGDTAHLPYGDKSAESIRHYSEHITAFLLEQGAKMVVIACNTASSLAYDHVVERFGDQVTVINVIDPVVATVKEEFHGISIGVIGTKGTTGSRMYPRKFRKEIPELQVRTMATPLLAPMIEEGYYNNKISRTIIRSYLSSYYLRKVEGLLLACTHYPLIKREIKAYYGSAFPLFDNAEIVARAIRDHLKQSDGLSTGNALALKHRFYVSDFTHSFEKSAELFFGENIHLREYRLWEKLERRPI